MKTEIEKITARRKRLGITQMQLAARSGVSWSTISKLEAGHAMNPTIETLAKLRRALARAPKPRK